MLFLLSVLSSLSLFLGTDIPKGAKDDPTRRFPLDRERAAFELSLTKVGSHFQSSHEAEVSQA